MIGVKVNYFLLVHVLLIEFFSFAAMYSFQVLSLRN